MNERRINPAPDNQRKFVIPTDPDFGGDFPDQAEVMVFLPPETAAEQEVFYKPIPGSMKNLRFQQKKIHWMNNFGIKKKNAADYENRVARYDIQLKHIAGANYVFYDGSRVRALSITGPVEGLVSAQLDLGDPPVGWVK